MKLSLPNDWEGVTLGEFIKLSKLTASDDIKYYVDIINVFDNDITVDEVNKWDENTLASTLSHLSFLKNGVDEVNKIDKVKVEDKEFKILNLNKLTVGEYISIQTLIDTKKLDVIQSIPIVLSVILRPSNETFNSDLVNDRIELFKSKLSITDALGLSKIFFEWQKVVVQNYSGLFESKKTDDDIEDEGVSTEPILNPKWRWFAIIERLADGDITKFELIYKQNYINSLNLLSYWKERDEYQKRLQRRQDMMNKHK